MMMTNLTRLNKVMEQQVIPDQKAHSFHGIVKIIRANIALMDQGDFETFCYTLLRATDVELAQLQPNTTAFNKTRRGASDMYVHDGEKDEYTVVLCTTQKQGLLKKVQDDLSAFKTNARWANRKICKYIFCFADAPQQDAQLDINDYCVKQGLSFEVRTGQRLASDAFDCERVMREYFREHWHPTPSMPLAFDTHRRFVAGERLKKVRQDLDMNEAEFIDTVLQYPSQIAYREVEGEQTDIEAHFLELAANYGSADPLWMKFGTGRPYNPRRLRRHAYIEDLAARGDNIENLERAFVVLDPQEMRAGLLLECSARRWWWWIFDDSWDIWNWTWGDEKYVPEFLNMLRYINQTYHPYGLLVSTEQFSELLSGQIHPESWQAKAGRWLPWFDDLFDIHHKYSHLVPQYENYGKWFLDIQRSFRDYGTEN